MTKGNGPFGFITEAVNIKRNYSLVAWIVGSQVVALFLILWRLSGLLREVVAALLVIGILCSILWIPYLMKKIPPSEEHTERMAELGFREIDGTVIPIESSQPRTEPNPPLLPPAKRNRENETKE